MVVSVREGRTLISDRIERSISIALVPVMVPTLISDRIESFVAIVGILDINASVDLG